MNLKPLILLGSFIAILGTVLTYKSFSKHDMLTIGILQTASHPALDQARDSFMAEMTQLTHGKVCYVIQNAEGSLVSAQSIAENFHVHQKIDAIYAIATPAVQAAARVEKEKPIFIAAVTDPESLGIIHPGTNICGTTDRVDTEAQADLIKKVVPTAQTVAIVYNPGENNSQIMVKNMEQSLQKRGLKTVMLGVHSESEIAQTIATAAHKAEVILVPGDNLLVGAMPLAAREALKRGRPLFASDIPSVAKGALAAQGADYSELGKTTAQMASRVLILGERPESVGVVHPSNAKLVTNPKVMEALGISLPQELCNE